jgi:hypothetical protein
MTDTVSVASFRTRIEAEVAAQVLENLGIPCVVNSPESMACGPLGTGTVILVRAEDAELAREALTVDQALDVEPRVVRLGPDLPADEARTLSDALRRASIQVLTRTSWSDEGTDPRVSVFVRRDQAEDARQVLERMRKGG